MAIRKINAPKGTVLLGLLTVSILLYFVPHRITKYLSLSFYDLFSFVLQIGKSSSEPFRMTSASDEYVSKDEYDLLWKNFKNLSAQMDELQQENVLLGGIRKDFGLAQANLLTVKVMTLTRTPRQEIIINQGQELGIGPGMYVLSPDTKSIIGIVKEASGSIARIQLLTDSALGIEVRIRRDGTKMDIPAQMFGDGKKGGRIGFIPRDTDVRAGDTVFASANKEKLPVPIVIGEISEVKANEQSPLLWDISVRPVDNPELLNEVVIIIPKGVHKS